VSEPVVTFGPFQLLAEQRLLLENGKPVALGSRALDILLALVESAGAVVSKEQLIARVWPDTVVEEANLRVHIAALRKALGDGHNGRRFISNIPGRGYSFVAAVDRQQGSAGASETPAPRPGRTYNLPARLTRLIGRAEVVCTLVAQLPQRRLITIAGPGGVGKTSVALAVADASATSYRDGAAFIDLAPIADPLLVPSALASVLGLALRSGDPIPRLVSALHDRQMLIVLDCCEHVIEPAAVLVEALLKHAPGVSVLATSREPLRADGEWVHRLPPLGLPPPSITLTAKEALQWPAVQLFVERASAGLGGFELADAEAPVVAEICRRLDGIALAIEFAAGRVEAFGVQGLTTLLNDRFKVLTRGRRTALPRQQTLRATLDWSYEHLPQPEQFTLRRLSIFNGVFTLDAAREVVTDDDIPSENIHDRLASLIAKSLVVTGVSDADLHYRLLDTTRAYALEKLDESGERERRARRHAEYYRGLFERAETEWETRPTREWLTHYGREIDNLRAALAWAFSPAGDTSVGIALAVAAVPLWFQLSLVDECLGWVERALAALDMAPEQNERRRMQLYAALGWLQMYATAKLENSTAAWRTALRLAEELGDTDYQLRALWALWADRINHAEFREALTLASQFRSRSARAGNVADQLVGDRITGASLHFLGNQAGARECIERMLERYTTPISRSHAVRFQFDQRVTARYTLARVLWLQGFADQAVRDVTDNIEQAVSQNHVLSLCNALAQSACPIALLVGDFGMAERYTAMLRSHTTKNSLDVWRAYADGFDGERLIRCGDLDGGLSLLRRAVDELWHAGFVQYHTAFLIALALGLVHAGQAADARVMIEKALQRCERTGESWALAELHRIRGKTLLSEQTSSANPAVEAAFLQSLDIAREQKVLSWELRTAVSLAKLWRDQRRLREARDLLTSIYPRFTEGFGTSDLVSAVAVMNELDQPARA
jgi:predicted ATPase/DNA-binding winged helix-turn-helix (wHTH) protein